MAASTKRTNWRTFGWQGITFRVPKDWCLGKVTGDAKSGYARLDDSLMARIELEWRTGRGLHSVSQIVDKYLANLKKEARQKGSAFEAERHLDLFREEGAQEGRDYECFRWITDCRAHNLARRCPECGRIVLVRVLAKRGEHVEDLVRSVFASLRDHPEGGRHTWAVYDLECAVPEAFQLLEHSLKSGNIQLTFHDPKKKPEHILQVEYVALAGMLLRRVSLMRWFEGFYSKWLRDFQISDEPAHIQDHPGIQVRGRPKSRWRQALVPMPFLRRRPRRHMRAWAWHCPPTNKLFVVRAAGKDASDPLFEEMPVEVVCHQTQAAPEPRGDARLSPRAQ